MDQISVPGVGLKRLGCLKAVSLRSEDLKVAKRTPRRSQMAPTQDPQAEEIGRHEVVIQALDDYFRFRKRS